LVPETTARNLPDDVEESGAIRKNPVKPMWAWVSGKKLDVEAENPDNQALAGS
jgi:hypothetical protein